MTVLRILFIVVLTVLQVACSTLEKNSVQPTTDSFNYLVGRGISDVTGPAYGMQLWGFGKLEQVSQGLHIRLKSRAFIIGDPQNGSRLVFVCVELGALDHNLALEVVDRLQSKLGDVYTMNNVIIGDIHTHSGSSGFWHMRTSDGLAGDFYQEYFDHIVDGITSSILKAHNDLQLGSILLNKGMVENAGRNRSLIAYEQNSQTE